MNACQKGKRGEREWRDELRTRFGLTEARRGRQFSGSDESPDVVGGWPGTHAEVKRVESLNIAKAMDQAIRDCGSNIPYVAHRRNSRPWLITLRVEDLLDFVKKVYDQSSAVYLDDPIPTTENLL